MTHTYLAYYIQFVINIFGTTSLGRMKQHFISTNTNPPHANTYNNNTTHITTHSEDTYQYHHFLFSFALGLKLPYQKSKLNTTHIKYIKRHFTPKYNDHFLLL